MGCSEDPACKTPAPTCRPTTPLVTPAHCADLSQHGSAAGVAARPGVDEHLAVFAAPLTQGLLAASTAVGLEVMR
jgi:hypothetical protein